MGAPRQIDDGWSINRVRSPEFDLNQPAGRNATLSCFHITNNRRHTMFRNILVPTDGSALSRKGIKKAVALAKITGARITGFHVAPSYKFNVYADYVPPDFILPRDYQARAKKV